MSPRPQSRQLLVSFARRFVIRHGFSVPRPVPAVKSVYRTATEFPMLLLLGMMLVAVTVATNRTELLNRAFVRAMGKCCLSLKETAALMREDERQLRRELDGIGHVSLTRITNMPEEFVQTFALEMVAAFGLPAEVRLGQMIAERAL